MTVLILSPHCDDAPLCIGGAFLRKFFGAAPQVKIIFSRSRYTLKCPCTGPVDEISTLRMREEREAAETAGYQVGFLQFGEPFVRSGFTSLTEILDTRREATADPIWGRAYEAVKEMLDGHAGLVLAPLGCGEHIDHRIVKAIALEYNSQHPGTKIGFYEDLPYAAELDEAEVLAKVPRIVGKPLQPVVVPGDVGAKLELLRVYKSQLDEAQLDCVRDYWQRHGGERLWLPTPE